MSCIKYQQKSRRTMEQPKYDWKNDIYSFKYKSFELGKAKPWNKCSLKINYRRKLGIGQQGCVWQDKSNKYAIKVSSFEDEKEYHIERAKQEKLLLSKTKISIIYGVYYTYKSVYKIYPKYSYNLTQMIEDENDVMNESQLKEMVSDICICLHALHKEKFIHRDIKPSNIMYNEQSQKYKLVDFDSIQHNYTNKYIYTYFAGTLSFTAPEMYDYNGYKNKVGYAVDIWALGVVMIFCLCSDIRGFYYRDNDTFQKWYKRLYAMDNKYKIQIYKLYKSNMISEEFYKLLMYGVFVKNPDKRITANGILKSKWISIKDDILSDSSSSDSDSDEDTSSSGCSSDDNSDSEYDESYTNESESE